MDASRFQDWLQIAGLFGVIASLIFVGLEMRQNREIAIADIYQQRAAMVIEVQNNRFSPDQYRKALSKATSNQPLTASESALLQSSWNP